MPDPREGLDRGSARNAGRNLVLALTLIFVLAAVAFSTGLVVHDAWTHDLNNGPFAVLSARAALAWASFGSQPSAVSYQQERVGRKPADEATR